MAPRRLVLAMILLLAISTVIAVVTPDPSQRDATRTEQADGESRDRAGDNPPVPGGRQDETDVEAADRDQGDSGSTPRSEVVTVGGPVEVLRVRPGQRIVLEVKADRTTELEIPELGRTSTSDPFAPAIFDLIAPETKSDLEIVEMPGGRSVGRILVREARAAALMTSRGGSRPVQISRDSAPCLTRTSIPSTVRAPFRAADSRSSLGRSP